MGIFLTNTYHDWSLIYCAKVMLEGIILPKLIKNLIGHCGLNKNNPILKLSEKKGKKSMHKKNIVSMTQTNTDLAFAAKRSVFPALIFNKWVGVGVVSHCAF